MAWESCYIRSFHTCKRIQRCLSHTLSIPKTMLQPASKMQHRFESRQGNEMSCTKHTCRTPLTVAAGACKLPQHPLHRQAVRAQPSPEDPMHYHCYWYDAATLTQTIVYGSELLQIGCRLLTDAGWAAHWHYYVETTGRTCTENLMTSCTCLATMLTPVAGDRFLVAEIPGLLGQSDQAKINRYSVNIDHGACMCIGYTHRSRSKCTHRWLVSQSENESAVRDSRLHRANLMTTAAESVSDARTHETLADPRDDSGSNNFDSC